MNGKLKVLTAGVLFFMGGQFVQAQQKKDEAKEKEIEEVVVVGYGTQKKRDLTGSVVSVKNEDVVAAPTSNVMEALQGKIAGLDITKSSGQVGGGVNILLRGSRSIYGDNSPLFIRVSSSVFQFLVSKTM